MSINRSLVVILGATVALAGPARGGQIVLTPPAPLICVAGQPARDTIGISRVGFTGAVTLAVSATPAGTSTTFAPNPVVGATAAVTMASAANAPVGSSSLVVKATAAGATTVAWIAPVEVRACGREWLVQDGTNDWDSTAAVAATPSGGFFAGGRSYGSLAGPNPDPTGGSSDGWLALHDRSGARVWRIAIGLVAEDAVTSLVALPDGGVIASGSTKGALFGATIGQQDLWVARYDAAGARTWSSKFGTTANDWSDRIAVTAAGDPVVAWGNGNQRRLRKLDGATGALRWERVFADTDSRAYGVAVAADGDLLQISTTATPVQARLARLTTDGVVRWTRTFDAGTGWTAAEDVAALPGNGFVVVGRTSEGAYLTRFNTGGTALATTRWAGVVAGFPAIDALQVAVDPAGNAYVAGGTQVPVNGAAVVAGVDAWVARVSTANVVEWARTIGSPDHEAVLAIAVDRFGSLITGGYTWGALAAAPSAGRMDLFLARFARAVCDGDGDNILPDGDGDDVNGDHACSPGTSYGCDDNCPAQSNPNQADGDGDGLGDACDLCPQLAGAANTDLDHDGLGDACDCDDDNDGYNDPVAGCPGPADNCPWIANPDQIDLDGDWVGYACDPDEPMPWMQWLVDGRFDALAVKMQGRGIGGPWGPWGPLVSCSDDCPAEVDQAYAQGLVVYAAWSAVHHFDTKLSRDEVLEYLRFDGEVSKPLSQVKLMQLDDAM